MSDSYLRSHIERRHPNEAKQFHSTKLPLETQSYQDVNLINELSDIKTRLQMTENQLNQERENFSITRVQVSKHLLIDWNEWCVKLFFLTAID